tara:strand:+ start:817 stop:1110 length:294 start_codon:yes stop_codon:yes gene_type:complete
MNTQKRRRKKRRHDLINAQGGICNRCKLVYNGDNAYIFDFHHKEGVEKLFTVGETNMNRRWSVVQKEAEKCILLCSNCHRTVHYENKCKKVTQSKTE